MSNKFITPKTRRNVFVDIAPNDARAAGLIFCRQVVSSSLKYDVEKVNELVRMLQNREIDLVDVLGRTGKENETLRKITPFNYGDILQRAPKVEIQNNSVQCDLENLFGMTKDQLRKSFTDVDDYKGQMTTQNGYFNCKEEIVTPLMCIPKTDVLAAEISADISACTQVSSNTVASVQGQQVQPAFSQYDITPYGIPAMSILNTAEYKLPPGTNSGVELASSVYGCITRLTQHDKILGADLLSAADSKQVAAHSKYRTVTVDEDTNDPYDAKLRTGRVSAPKTPFIPTRSYESFYRSVDALFPMMGAKKGIQKANQQYYDGVPLTDKHRKYMEYVAVLRHALVAPITTKTTVSKKVTAFLDYCSVYRGEIADKKIEDWPAFSEPLDFDDPNYKLPRIWYMDQTDRNLALTVYHNFKDQVQVLLYKAKQTEITKFDEVLKKGGVYAVADIPKKVGKFVYISLESGHVTKNKKISKSIKQGALLLENWLLDKHPDITHWIKVCPLETVLSMLQDQTIPGDELIEKQIGEQCIPYAGEHFSTICNVKMTDPDVSMIHWYGSHDGTLILTNLYHRGEVNPQNYGIAVGVPAVHFLTYPFHRKSFLSSVDVFEEYASDLAFMPPIGEFSFLPADNSQITEYDASVFADDAKILFDLSEKELNRIAQQIPKAEASTKKEKVEEKPKVNPLIKETTKPLSLLERVKAKKVRKEESSDSEDSEQSETIDYDVTFN